MEYVLEVNNLTKEYRNFSLNVTFNIKKGYITGLIGPNGAGKTTIIKLIMNLLRRDKGSVLIFGKDSMEHEVAVKEKIGFVCDHNVYYEELSPKEIQAIIAPFYKMWDRNLFKRYLNRFDLPPTKKIKHFSRGMKAKFSLAAALSHHAELIILDEPTSGLDPVFRQELLEIFSELIEDESHSILFSTHITGDLERIADYITFINNGQLIFNMDKDTVFESYAIVKGSLELLNEEMQNYLVGVRKNPYGFEGLTANAREVQKQFGEQILIEKASLEDIMLYTVKGDS
jgi:ABC-2 type transport system ATP-binding protein